MYAYRLTVVECLSVMHGQVRLLVLALVAISAFGQDVKLQIGTEEQKHEFHIREPIHLQLVFTSLMSDRYRLSAGPGRLNRRHDGGFEEVTISPEEGWEDPWGSYRAPDSGSYSLNRHLVALSASQSASVYIPLQEYVRFLKPGRYQIRVRSTRVLGLRDPGGTEPVSVLSNSIFLTIVVATPQWEREQLEQALADVRKDSSGAVENACERLSTLDTGPAIAALIDLLPDHGECSQEDLLHSSQREFILKTLQQRFDDPKRSSGWVLSTLAMMMAAQSGPPDQLGNRQLEIQHRLAEQLFNDLPAKEESARAATVSFLLNESLSGWRDQDKTWIQRFFDMAVEMFPDLTSGGQSILLSARWDMVRGPAMLPPLRAYLSGRRSRDNDEFALYRLFELSPDEARAIILEDMHRPAPRFQVSALGILPDKELPELNETLADRLQAGFGVRELERTAGLIQRFASAAILPKVTSFYDQDTTHSSCETQNSLLAFMLRTQPTYALSRIRDALGARTEGICFKSLLSNVSTLEPSSKLQSLAIEFLDDPDLQVEDSAASALSKIGDNTGKDALWARFQKWHDKWVSHEDELTRRTANIFQTDAPLGETLFRTLISADNWVLTNAELDRLSSLAIGNQGTRYLLDEARRRPVFVSIFIDAMNKTLRVGSYECRSMELFMHKIDQYPDGTVFVASDPSTGNAAYAKRMHDLGESLSNRGQRLTFLMPQSAQ
jgi:hypothetical protein